MGSSAVGRSESRHAGALGLISLLVAWATPVAILLLTIPGAKAEQHAATTMSAPAVITVGSRYVDARQEAVVTARLAPVPQAFSPVSGTVTAVHLAVGAAVDDGAELFSVDGHPLTAFVQDAPLYRELRAGDSGPDVRALGAHLVSLHLLDGPADGAFGARMVAATQAYQARFGHLKDGVFRPSYVVFVPTGFGAASAISATTGRRIDEQSPALSGTAPVTSLEIRLSRPDPGGLGAAGKGLVLAVGDSRTALSSLRPTESELKTIWAALEERARRGELIRSSSDASDGPTVQFEGAHVALADPISHGSIPASAVHTTAGGTTCVFLYRTVGRFAAQRVTVAPDSGEVGQSLVAPELIGRRLVRDASSLPREVLETCASS